MNRAAFEAWVKVNALNIEFPLDLQLRVTYGTPVDIDRRGPYISPKTCAALAVWKARQAEIDALKAQIEVPARHLHYTRDISMSEANMLVDFINRQEAKLAALISADALQAKEI